MAPNDIILLDKLLGQKKKDLAETLADDTYFEIFTFEQVLKNYELSYEELLEGKVGGADDGGIDGFFVFINGELVDEDSDFSAIRKNPSIIVFLIQSKRSTTFSEKAVESAISTIGEIFDLTKDMVALRSIYNERLIEKAEIFRNCYMQLASLHPNLQVNYIYASKGDKGGIHPKIIHKAENLKNTILGKFPGSNTLEKFMGARELLEAARKEKSFTLQLRFLENYISRGENDYVILTTLKDYYDFVVDEEKTLRRYIFESNVRDYQGDVEVNKDIQKSLESTDALDFWWLNNGITILASKASIAGKTITLDDVQVVNGLQTTTTIYNHLRQKNSEDIEKESRAILIRIIVTSNSETRDRIIKATNFQTSIPPASLRATDRIHRDIEDFFHSHGWYYERRKNYYKNLEKPVDKIISIPYLAQAIMAIVLCEPHNARSKPSSLIKREDDYKRVFNDDISLDVYFYCAKLLKQIEDFIRSSAIEYTVHDKSNLKYHFAMYLISKLIKKATYKVSEVETLEKSESKISTEMFQQALADVIRIAKEYAMANGNQPINTVAKSKAFVTYLMENFSTTPDSV